MMKSTVVSIAFIVSFLWPLWSQVAEKSPRPVPVQAGESASELDGLWHFVRSESVPPGAPNARAPNYWPPRAEEAAYIVNNQFAYARRNGMLSRSDAPLTIKVDSKKTPKSLDFKVGQATYLGIYKIDGGELTIATQFSSETRPDTFSTTAAGPGRAAHVRVYTRAKESPEDVAAKAIPALDPKVQILDGLWALEEVEENYGGRDEYPYRAEEALYFEKNTWTLATKNGWQVMGPTYEIATDPNALPPTIDITIGNDFMRAIYKVEGDVLTIAAAKVNDDRPRYFSTRLASGRASSVRRYVRVAPTEDILKLKQTGKLDRAKQLLEGLWVVAQFKNNISPRDKVPRFPVPEAVYFENGKWLTAKANGTLQPKEAKYDFEVDTSKPIPTLEMRVYGGELVRWIYKIEGDALYFATNLNSEELPKYFTTNLTAGPGRALCAVVFTRPGAKASAIVAEDDPKPKSPAKASSEIDGYWFLQTVDNNPPPGVRGWEVREDAIYIENGKYQLADKNGRLKFGTPFLVKADATKDPKTFDYKTGTGTWRGIYKVEGDLLTVATNFTAESRPESFATKVDAGPGRAFHVRVYRRIQETPENAKQKALAPLDAKTQVLDGLWKFESEEDNSARGGWQLPRENVLIEGDGGYFERRNKTLSDKSVAIRSNPNAAPPTLDLTFNRQTMHAIYKIENNRLTIASCLEDDGRPLWFINTLTAGVGRAHHLRVYVRIPPTPEVSKLKQIVKVAPATQKLDGLWIVEERSSYATGRPTAFSLGEAVYIEKGKWQSATKNGTLTKNVIAIFTSDPRAPIPTIDLKVNRDETVRGVYRIEGDTLYFAGNFGDNDRPRFLTSALTAGVGRATISGVLKRVNR